MKIGRLILALVGLAALAVAYYTGSIYFLAIAVIAFVVGLYVMGANRKPIKKDHDQKQNQDRK